MREIRLYGSEGGGPGNRFSLPLSIDPIRPMRGIAGHQRSFNRGDSRDETVNSGR